MKRYLLIVTVLFMFLLTGCINRDGPCYIESVDVYVEGVLLEGYIQYYDKTENKWIDFDDKTKNKMNVYYTFDVSLEDNIQVIFTFYNPKIALREVKVVYIDDFKSSETTFVFPEEKVEEHTKVIINIEDYDGSFGVLKVPSWLSDRGLKYQGKKHPDGNYTIWGIHLNIS